MTAMTSGLEAWKQMMVSTGTYCGNNTAPEISTAGVVFGRVDNVMAVHDMAILAKSSRIVFKPEALIRVNPHPATLQ